jgi:hypothetical protein
MTATGRMPRDVRELEEEYRFLVGVLGFWALAFGLTDNLTPAYVGPAPGPDDHPHLRVANVDLFRSMGRIYVRLDIGSEIQERVFRWDEHGAVLVEQSNVPVDY